MTIPVADGVACLPELLEYVDVLLPNERGGLPHDYQEGDIGRGA